MRPDVLVVTSSWPRTGDEIAGTFVRTDAIARARTGQRVLIAAPAGPGAARGGEGIEVVDVPHLGLFGAPGAVHRLREAPHRLTGLAPFAAAVARLCARRRPRAIVAHWLAPCGAIVRAIADVPVELVAHGGDVRLLEAAPRAIARPFLEWLSAGQGTIRAVSHGLAARLAAIAPGVSPRVEPMPLAIDDLASALAGRHALRARFAKPIHVVAARMVPEKHIERALAFVRAGTLVLVGDGPARDALVATARAAGVSVHATGAVPHEEALAWIAAADQVVAPLARGEGAPTVVREAHALGVPVLALEDDARRSRAADASARRAGPGPLRVRASPADPR